MRCHQCDSENPTGFRFCGYCGISLRKVCPNCNYENFQKAKFCNRCGTTVGNLCPNCRSDNPPDARFCSECGYQLDKVCIECNTINPLYAKFCNVCGKELPETILQLPATEQASTAQQITPFVQPKKAPDIPKPPQVSETTPPTITPPEGETSPTTEVVVPRSDETEEQPSVLPDSVVAEEPPHEDVGKLRELEKYIPDALLHEIYSTGKKIEGEIKTVTMIFSDLSGYTAISEKFGEDDPDELQRILHECLHRQSLCVYELGGIVDKIVGDELMALFGAPIAHENGPELAIAAAMKMRESVIHYAEEVEIPLDVHIGINTGRVMVGSIGGQKLLNYTVVGDPVNLAARIEGIAQAGEIVVGELTYKLTNAVFDFERTPEKVTLKNKKEPQYLYKLIGDKEQPESKRGIKGLTAEMIGRDKEMTALSACAEVAFASKTQMLSIIGEAGLGKSRLKREFKDKVGDKVVWIEGRCFTHTQNSAYSLFIDAIKLQFGLRSADTEEEMKNKLQTGVSELFTEEYNISPTHDILPYLFHLMSLKLDDEMEREFSALFEDAEHFQKQAFVAIKDLFQQLAKNKPLVLALEDLHWVDNLSLNLILFLLDKMMDSPTFFPCIYRPEVEDACWQLGVTAKKGFSQNYSEIVLEKLSEEDTRRLLDVLLPLDETEESNKLKELLLSKADRNPFYLEEVIRTLLDEKLVEQTSGGKYVVMSEISDIDVPVGVEAVVRGRIDRLSSSQDGAKETLLLASVVGREFERKILAEISAENANLNDHLERLVNLRLIEKNSVNDAEEKYSFHTLTYDIIYDSIPKRVRRELHGQVGDCMEKIYPEHLHRDKLEIIANHYKLSDNHEKAAIYSIKSAHRARLMYNNDVAIESYNHALERMEKIVGDATELSDGEGQNGFAQMKAETYGGLADVYRATSKFEDALSNYQKALEFCEALEIRAAIYRKMGDIYEKSDYDTAEEHYRLGLDELKEKPDSPEIPRLYNGIAFIHFRRGNHPEMVKMCEDALEMLNGMPDYVTIAMVRKNMAIASFSTGDIAKAHENIDMSVQMADRTNDKMLLAQLYVTKGTIYERTGHLDDSIKDYESSLKLREELGDINGQATAMNSLGIAYTRKAEYDKAADYISDALNIAQDVGDVRLMGDSHVNLAIVYRYMKEYDKALEHYQNGLAKLEEIGNARNIAITTGNIADIYYKMGNLDDAEQYQLKAIKMAEELAIKQIQPHQYHNLGEIQLAKGDTQDAMESFKVALGFAEELSDKQSIGSAYMGMGKVCIETSDSKLATEHLNKAIEQYEAAGAKAALEEAQELLESIGGE